MTQKKSFGIGIVGCGSVASVHAEAIKEMDYADLISVFSRNPDNAHRLAEKYDIPAFNDWDSFIRNDRLDLVHVCTPSGNHLDYGSKIAEAGKHVIVEKPIEVTLERGRRLIDLCKQAGVQLAVVYQNRFLPDAVKLKQLVDDAQLGKVFLADATIKWYRDQTYYDSADWRGTMKLDGGGVLINQAIHTIDLLQWIVGKVKTVHALTGTYTHSGIEGEDNAVAVIQFNGGAIGTIEASTSVSPAQNRRLEIHGRKGTAILDGEKLRHETQDGFTTTPLMNGKKPASGASAPMQDFSVLPHRRQFESILQALKEGKQPPVSGEESLQSLGIVLSIYKSAKTGKPVNVQAFMSNLSNKSE